jgi:hypothetical protein
MEGLKGEERYKVDQSLTHACLFQINYKFMFLRSIYTAFYCSLAVKIDNSQKRKNEHTLVLQFSFFENNNIVGYINHSLIFYMNPT